MYGVMRKQWMVYATAIFFSIVLSFWAYAREIVINPDAICYLQTAESMSQGLKVASQLCDQAKWPFYSALIYFFTRVTSFSYLHSAYFLNGIFSLLTVVCFIAIVRFLKGSTRTLWFAALVVLLAHDFNSAREYIVRDHGFLAFYMLSILLLLQFFRTQQWRFAMAWGASLVIAILFRLEAFFFLALLPWVALVHGESFSQRIKSFLKLNTVVLVCIAVFALWFVTHPKQSLDHVGRIEELRFQLTHGLSLLTHNFTSRTQFISQHVMSDYSSHDAILVFSLVLIVWYFINVIQNLSLIYALLVAYAWFKKLLKPESPARLILWFYILVNVLVTGVFLVEAMFLSKRYLLALSLTLMLWIPFALDYLTEVGRRKWVLYLVLVLIVLNSLGGIFDFGYSKRYIRDAGRWLETNVSKEARLYTNDYQVMYYSEHFNTDIFVKAREFANENVIADGKWKQYDYIALRLDKQNSEKIKKELGEPVQVFSNNRGDEVAIFKIES